MAVPTVKEAPLVPEWEVSGPLVHLLGVGVPDSIAAAVLEAEDSREGAATAFQEGVGEVEDKIHPPSFSPLFSERGYYQVIDYKDCLTTCPIKLYSVGLQT